MNEVSDLKKYTLHFNGLEVISLIFCENVIFAIGFIIIVRSLIDEKIVLVPSGFVDETNSSVLTKYDISHLY